MYLKDAIVKRFDQYCRERCIAYNELANSSGVTPSTVYSMLDSERRDVSVKTVKRLCDGLEISLSEFFSSELFDELDEDL